MLGTNPHFREASLKCFQNQGHHHHYSHPQQQLEIQKANVAELAWDRALTRGGLPPKNTSQGWAVFRPHYPQIRIHDSETAYVLEWQCELQVSRWILKNWWPICKRWEALHPHQTQHAQSYKLPTMDCFVIFCQLNPSVHCETHRPKQNSKDRRSHVTSFQL